jgi:hypothetical protein
METLDAGGNPGQKKRLDLKKALKKRPYAKLS